MPMMQRPRMTVVLAMSADGKVGDAQRNHPTFGSKEDWNHLERQVAQSDAVLFGAGTLRAGGSAMRVVNSDLIEQRLKAGATAQPTQIVCTRSGQIDGTLPFFSQPVPRWLLSTLKGAEAWHNSPQFDQVLGVETESGDIDWSFFFRHCLISNIQTIAVLGGGQLIASLLELQLIDELWLTVCPVLIGGAESPTPLDGVGFAQDEAPRLLLMESRQVGDELFLHYQVLHSSSND